MRLAHHIISLLFVVAALPACLTTPLPVPPTLDAEQVTIEDHEGGALITGEPGAFSPTDADIRVSYGDEHIDSIPPERAEVVVDDDGAFQTWVMGTSRSRFFVEVLLDDEDRFVLAITGDAESPPRAVETDPGPDADGDGSPDRIDCAPLDETVGGRRCP